MAQIKCPEPKCQLRVTDCFIRGLSSKETFERHQARATRCGERPALLAPVALSREQRGVSWKKRGGPADPLTPRLCVPPAVQQQYFIQKSFVDDSTDKIWCPTPNCGLAVDTRDASSKFVCCASGHHFCAECRQEAHAPASCETVKKWLKKCSDDSETYNWLSANTQDCPQCKSTIEKNGGCNHSAQSRRPPAAPLPLFAAAGDRPPDRPRALLAARGPVTCRHCKGEFCWVCLVCFNAPGFPLPSRLLPAFTFRAISHPRFFPDSPAAAPRVPQGVWKEHTDFYSCNRYSATTGKDKESAKTASRAALDRYLFYYHRCGPAGGRPGSHACIE